MDPFTLLAAAIGTAVAGTVSNRSDSLFCVAMRSVVSRLRETGQPLNQDLQRAVRKAALQAAIAACDARLQDLGISIRFGRPRGTDHHPSTEVRWIAGVRRELREALDRVRAGKYLEPAEPVLDEMALFLTERPGQSAQARIGELRSQIESELLQELQALGGGKPVPERFERFLREGWQQSWHPPVKLDWFTLFNAFIVHEVKRNEELRGVLIGQILAGLVEVDLGLTPAAIDTQLATWGGQALEQLTQLDDKIEMLRHEGSAAFARVEADIDLMLPYLLALQDLTELPTMVQELLRAEEETRDLVLDLGAQQTAKLDELLRRPAPAELAESDMALSPTIQGAIQAQNEELAAWSAEWIGHGLQEARTAFREGRPAQALAWAEGLRANRLRWNSVPNDTRARVLRFQASVVAHRSEGIASARELMAEAQTLAPSLDMSIPQALVAHRSGGPEAGLACLSDLNDWDQRTLRAGFLLQLGRVDDAIAVLDQMLASDPNNAEPLRLRALCLLAQGSFEDALRAAELARELQPTWVATREIAAAMGYLCSLSPAIMPPHLPVAPEPVPWLLVCQDDEAVERLRSAASIFRELAQHASLDDREGLRADAWRLASLANDTERQPEAEECCRGMLMANPADFVAIGWALARGWDIDLGPAQLRLSAMLDQDMAGLPHAVALIRLYLAHGDPAAAISVLERGFEIFRAGDAGQLWESLRMQAAAHQGDSETAFRLVDGESSDPRALRGRATALEILAKSTGDSNPLLKHVAATFPESGDAMLRLNYCELMADYSRWEAVAEQASWLVGTIATAEAVRLAAIATFNERQFEGCLRLLDDHGHVFRHRQLPAQIREVRVRSLRAVGRLIDATDEAERLVQGDESAEHLALLGQLYVETGKFPALRAIVHRLAAMPDLSPSELLQTAALASLTDARRATELWQRAVRAGIPDDEVGRAIGLGYHLSLDAEMRPLMERLWELGNQGVSGFRLGTAQELLEEIRRRQEDQAHLDEVYRSGTAPVHLIAATAGIALAHLYHGRLLENDAAIAHHDPFALLVRHGGRASLGLVPADLREARLNVDITAILLAAHFGILDTIERAFRPIRIPPDLIRALVQMQERVAHPQPTRLTACTEVVQLADQGVLRVTPEEPSGDVDPGLFNELGRDRVALYESALRSNGHVLDFLPVRRPDLSGHEANVPNDILRRFVNCGAVVESLTRGGPLSQSGRERALATLGTEGEISDSATIPPQGTALYCRGTVRLLAEAGLLRMACNRFAVHVEQREIDEARAEIAAGQQRAELDDWISELITRVNDGLQSGSYEFIAVPPPLHRELVEDIADLSTQCVLDLLRFATGPGDVVWVDDRYLSGYLHRETAPIVGVYEVLQALEDREAVSAEQRYQLLHRLRLANLMFLPVEPTELLYHLGQAQIHNGQVVQTEELRNLRRYVAQCFRRGNRLQRSAPQLGPAGQFGEVAFLRSLTRTVQAALVRVFDGTEDVVSRARANWLLTNVLVEDTALARLADLPSSDADDHLRSALTLASLLTATLVTAPDPGSPSREVRGRYLRWLTGRVVAPRLHASPELLPTVVQKVKEQLLGAHEVWRRASATAADAVVQAVYTDLPTVITKELDQDSEFMVSIGAPTRTALGIAGVNFDIDTFWPGAVRAVRGERVVVQSIEPEAVIALRPYQGADGRRSFCFDHPTSGAEIVFPGDIGELLLESAEERRAALVRLRPRLDCSTENFAEVASELLASEPGKRIEQVNQWLRSSVAEHLRVLVERLSSREPLRWWDLMPPSVDGLLRHFRLSGNIDSRQPFAETLDSAGQKLSQEGSPEEAFARLAGLPIAIPASLLAQLAGLPDQRQREAVRTLLRASWSPVSRIHLARLLFHLGDTRPSYGYRGQYIVRKSLSVEGRAACEAFLGMAIFVTNELNLRPEARAWPVGIRLAVAWGYAHELYATLVSAGIPIDVLRERFGGLGTQVAADWIERDPDWWFDVAHPRRSSPETLVVSGMFHSYGRLGHPFLTERLHTLLADWLLRDVDGEFLLPAELFTDVRQARDALGTFLAVDRGEQLSALMDPAAVRVFGRDAARRSVTVELDRLAADPDQPQPWLGLQRSLGDLPSYDNVDDGLRSAMRRVSLSRLIESDAERGILAIAAIADRAFHTVDDELIGNLREGLVAVAWLLARVYPSIPETHEPAQANLEQAARSAVILLTSALTLSLADKQGLDRELAAFVEMVGRLVVAWPSTRATYEGLVRGWCEQLPVSISAHLWPALIQLRSV